MHDDQVAGTILLQVNGLDRPGIVAGVLGTLSDADAEIHDIEQIVIRNRISLSMVVEIPPGRDLLKELLLFGWRHDLEIDFAVVDAAPTVRRPGWVVTVIGNPLRPRDLGTITASIAAAGANIDRIERLSRYPVFSYELLLSGGDDGLRPALMTAAAAMPGVDVAIQREGLGRRAKRLVVLDVDSTLIQNEAIDLIADEAGVGEQVAAITERAMEGELDFGQALQERVDLLANQPAEILDRAVARLELTPGARTFVRTLKSLGFVVAIVSGGFSQFTDHLKDELGLDHAVSNRLEVRRGVLTGRTVGRVIDRQAKAEALREIAALEGIETSQVVAIGDGANDLDMLSEAGLGIAFNAKPVVRAAADTSVSVPYLDAILFVLGVRREEVEDAGLTRQGPDAN